MMKGIQTFRESKYFPGGVGIILLYISCGEYPSSLTFNLEWLSSTRLIMVLVSADGCCEFILTIAPVRIFLPCGVSKQKSIAR
jgi:hypothetical protein